MALTVIDPRGLDQTGNYTVNNLTATGVTTLSSPANLNIGGGTTDQVLSTNGSGTLSWVTAATGGGGGITAYALEAELPSGVNATNGMMGYVTGTNKMYLYNGSVWILVFTATTPNLAPAITTGPNAGYLLSTSGTPLVITMVAQDPESTPITWSYAITAGTLGSVATITQSTNVFTITPSTNTANGGAFELTITASDGVNLANARTYIRLRFTVEEPIYGLNYVSSLITPGASLSNTTNLALGKNVAANGGTLAIMGYGVTGTLVDTAKTSVYIFTTLSVVDPVYQARIDLPVGPVYMSSCKMCLVGDMLIVVGRDATTTFLSWLVYYRTAGVWSLTQTIVGDVAFATASVMPMGMSSTGLVFVCATPSSNDSAISGKTLIYTRATVATPTWTLTQTLVNADIPSTTADNDYFPGKIDISANGKHICLSGSVADGITPVIVDGGKLVIFTNTTYSSGGTIWASTYSLNTGRSYACTYQTVMTTTKYEDIFYLYWQGAGAVEGFLTCLTYISGSTWAKNDYDYAQTQKLIKNTAQTTGMYNSNSYSGMTALAGPDNSVSFVLLSVESAQTTVPLFIKIIKFVAADLNILPSNNKTITAWTTTSNSNNLTSSYYWAPASEILNPSNTTTTMLPRFCIDDLTGDAFLGASGITWGGILNSGVVHRYKLVAGVADSVTKTVVISSNTVYTIPVPPRCTYMSAVLVGQGGGGAGDSTATTAGGGGGGGSLLAFSNYPVVPGINVIMFGQVYNGVGSGGTGVGGGAVRVAGTAGADSYLTYGLITWTAQGGQVNGVSAGGAGGIATVPTLPSTPSYYSVVTGQGGNGGTANSATTVGGAGGGAGGYGGAGGNGQSSSATLNATAGNSGGGGGGCGGTNGSQGNDGGGVGIYGVGGAGVSGTLNSGYSTQVGQNGSVDRGLPTTAYGYGGAGSGYTPLGYGNSGGAGVVRVIFSNAPIYTFGSTEIATSRLVRNPIWTGS